MLVITRQQTRALQPVLERTFIQQLLEWVKHKYFAAGEIPDDLDQRIEAAYRRARGYRLQSRRNVAQFLDLDMRLGAGFENQPGNGWMKDILTNVSLSGPTRIYRIECRLERLAAVAASLTEESDA